AAPQTLRMDLSRAGVVTGHVLGPDDKPVTDAWIEADDYTVPAPVAGPGSGRGFQYRSNSGQDGAFSVTVPGDRPLRLRGRHTFMRPDPDRGTVEVVEPREGVVLRMVAGPTLAFGTPERAPYVQVRLFAGPLT